MDPAVSRTVAQAWSLTLLLCLCLASVAHSQQRLTPQVLKEWKADQDVAKDFLTDLNTPGARQEWNPVLWFFGAPVDMKRIGVGEEVEWIWWDDNPHSVEGEGPAKELFMGRGGGKDTVAERGFRYAVQFDKPGTYKYHCRVYASTMKGTVIVSPKLNQNGATIYWGDSTSYGGASAIIPVGRSVTFIWDDLAYHSLNLLSPSSDSTTFTGRGTGNYPVASNTDEPFTKVITFTRAGTYIYADITHSAVLRGNITVVSAATFARLKDREAEGATDF